MSEIIADAIFPMQGVNYTEEIEVNGVNTLVVKNDRAVDARRLSDFYRWLYTDGVFYNPSTHWQVVPGTGLSVIVKMGIGLVNGRMIWLDEEKIIDLKPETNLNRTDIIVMGEDEASLRNGYMKVLQGKSLVADLTRNANRYELGVARVRVRKDAVSITAADIEDMRPYSDWCGTVTGRVQSPDFEVYYAQFNQAAKEIIEGWEAERVSQSNEFDSFRVEQTAKYTELYNLLKNWFDTVKVEIAKIQTFDFDNKSSRPGTETVVSFNPPGGGILETEVMTVTRLKVAERLTEFNNADNIISETLTVYDSDGETVLQQTTVTTQQNPDGTISLISI